MRAIYREQGDKLYKVKGDHMIEINIESYEYGVIGIAYADRRTCMINMPNDRARVISKKEFDKYYKEAMQKIKLLK